MRVFTVMLTDDTSAGGYERAEMMTSSNTCEALDELSEESGRLVEVSFEPSDTRDLQVILDSPQKHVTPFETYVSYRIITKASREGYEDPEYVVRRRYSDFEWLRFRLAQSYPTHIIPPLPEKHTLFEQMDRYDRDFIDSRMQLLNRFLNRVADHPVLGRDRTYKNLLTQSQADFALHKKHTSGPGLLIRMSESLQSIAASYIAKDRAPEFERINDYVDKLAEKLQRMEKIGQRVQKERQGYTQDLMSLEPILVEWSESEAMLDSVLEAVAKAATGCGEAHEKLTEGYKQSLAMPMHEYGLYAQAAKEALAHRDSAQTDYEVRTEQLCRVRTEQNQLATLPPGQNPVAFGLNAWKSPEQVQQQRAQQLDTASTTLARQVELCRDKMESCNENLRADFERWNAIKTQDLRAILIEMADQHIRYYEQSVAAWSSALNNVKSN